jgi:hypothetical protein
MKKILPIFACMLSAITVNAQKEMPLYDGAIPNALPCQAKETTTNTGFFIIPNITVPTLPAYLPQK